MTETLKMSIILEVTPQVLYKAWLDSASHSGFTSSPAEIDPKVGGKYIAWDGYIYGTTLELDPPGRIVQTWETTEFPEGAPASRLEIIIKPVEAGSELTLIHTNIPDGQGDGYRQGWLDYYFEPMKDYFNGFR